MSLRMYRNRITRRQLKPWIEEAIINDEARNDAQKKRARSVKIVNHFEGLTTGRCTKHVTDGQVYIAANFTEEAVRNFLHDIGEEDLSTNWASALVIIHAYTVSYVPSSNLNHVSRAESEFVLHVDSFKLWDLQEGFSRKNQLVYIMDVPSVRQLAAKLRLEQLREQQSQSPTRDSCNPGDGQSDSIGLTQLLEEMGRASPGEGQEVPAAGQVLPGKNTQQKQAEKRDDKVTNDVPESLLQKLFRPMAMEEFLIAGEDELENIKEWQVDYMPSASTGASDGVSVSVQLPAPLDLSLNRDGRPVGKKVEIKIEEWQVDYRPSASTGASDGVSVSVQLPAPLDLSLNRDGRPVGKKVEIKIEDGKFKKTTGTACQERSQKRVQIQAGSAVARVMDGTPGPDENVGQGHTQGSCRYTSSASQSHSQSQIDSCAWQEGIDSVHLSHSDSSLELSSPVAYSTQVYKCLPLLDHPAVDLSLALNGLDNETGRQLEGNSSVLTSSDRTRNDNDAKDQLAVCNNKIANIGYSNTDILDLSHLDQSNSPRLLRSSCSSGSKVALPSDMIRDTFHPREEVMQDQSKINLSENDQEFTSVKDRDDHQADNSTFESISNSTLLAHCYSQVVSCQSIKQDSSQLQTLSASYSSSDKSVISPSPTNQNPRNRNTQLRLTFSALDKDEIGENSESSIVPLLSAYSLNSSQNTRPKVQLCTDKTDNKSIECRKDNSKNQSVQINTNNIDMMEVIKTDSERIRTENNKSVAAHNESIEADGATDTDNYLSTECRQTHRLETNYNDEHTIKIKLTEKHLTKAKIKCKTNKVRATESAFENQPVRIDEQKIAEINEMCKKNLKKIRCEKDKRNARISDNTHLLSFSNESLTDSINYYDATDGNIPNDENQHECNSGSDKIFVEHSEIEQNCKDCLPNSELDINDNVSPHIHNKVKNELHSPVRNKTAVNYGARPWVNEFCNWLKNHEVSGCHSKCTLCNQSSHLESQSHLNTLNMGQPDDTISDPNKYSENEAINTVSVDLVSDNNGSETQCRVETFQACTSPIIEQTDEIDFEQELDTLQSRSNNFPCTQEFVPTDRDMLQKEPIETQPLETCTQEFLPTDGDILQTQPTGTQPLETCTQEFVPSDGDILQTQPTGTQPFETEIFETQPYDLNTQSPQLSPDSNNSIEVVNASLQNKNITKRTCRLSKNAINKTKHMHVDMKSGQKIQIEVHSHDITSTNAVHTSPKDNSDKVSKQLSGIRRNLDDAFKKHKPINTTRRFIEIENKIPSDKTQNAVSGTEIASLQCDISRKPSQMLEGMTDASHQTISDSEAGSVVNEDAVNDGVLTVKKSKDLKYCKNNSSEQNTNTNELRTELMEGMPNLDKEVNNTLKKGNHIDRNSLIRLIDNILGTDYPEKQSSRMIYRVKGISGKPNGKKGQANRVKPIRHSVNKLEEKVSVKYKTLDKEKPCSGGIIMQHDSHHKSLVNQTQKTYEPELLIVDGHSAANKPQVRNAVGSSPDKQYKTDESISKNAETKIIVTSTVATDLDNCSSVGSNTRTQRVGHSAANKQQLENLVSSSHDTQYKTDESTPKTADSKVFVTPTVATQLGNCSSAGSNAPTQIVGSDGLVEEFVNGCPRFKRNQKCESEKQREQCKQLTVHNSDKGTLETVQISNKDKPERDTIVENKSDGIHCLRKRKSNREHVPENCEPEILLDFLRSGKSNPTKRRKTERKSNGYVNNSEACKLFKSDQQQNTSSSSNVSTVGKKINDLVISRVSLSPKTKFTRKDFTEDWVKLHSHTPMAAGEKPTSGGKTLDGSKDTCTHHSTHTTSPQDRTRDKAASEISVHKEWDAFLSRLKPQHPTTGERLRTVKLPSRLEKVIEKLTRIQQT